ncbi:hypothetical protein [Janthinobacterium sp. PSPC3-1]|uniref:hypothetical protein n=1 Tax=Janthinobacterium sp. PSPC3-1 TaxID=2804653 RepID=UPI003CF6C098
MADQSARVKELEARLTEVAAYLKALPLVPETYRQIHAIERLLTSNDDGNAPSVTGTITAPGGLVLMTARLTGAHLNVQGAVGAELPEEFRLRYARWLPAAIGKGINFQLGPTTQCPPLASPGPL